MRLFTGRVKALSAGGARLDPPASRLWISGAVLVLLFLGLLYYGLTAKDAPVSKQAAIATAAILLLLLSGLMKQKLFYPVTSVEVRYFPDSRYRAHISISHDRTGFESVSSIRYANGAVKVLPASGFVDNFQDCHSIELELPQAGSSSLLITASRISANLGTDPLGGDIGLISDENDEQVFWLNDRTGFTTVHVPANCRRVSVRLNS